MAVEYPVHMYKSGFRPQYAVDRKHYELLESEGWTDVRANAGGCDYPKRLYHPNGESRIVGDYNREGAVDFDKAKKEEREAAADGFSMTVVAPPPPIPHVAASASAPNSADALKVLSLELEILKLKGELAEKAPAPILQPRRTRNRSRKVADEAQAS